MAPESRIDRVRAALERRAGLVVLAIVALGGVLRARGLGTWALNPDEGIYRAVATAPSWGEFARGLGEAAHPPFFFLLLRALTTFGETPEWLRWPAALFGTLAIWGLFLLTRRAFGALPALVAAAALAVSPGAITLSQLVRPYALVFALLAFGWWALLGYLARGRRRDLWLYAGALGLALLTHYGSALALAATFGWLVLGAATGAVQRTRWRPLALLHAGALGLLGATYLLHFRDFRASANPFQSMGWLEPLLPASAGELWLSFVGLHHFLFGLEFDGMATLLTCVGLVVSFRRGAGSLGVLALIALGIGAGLAVAGLYPLGGTRHATYLFVLLLPVTAEGVHWLLSGRGLALPAGCVALALGVALPQLPDTLVGASKLRFGTQVERLATPEQLAALPVAELRERPVRVLLDQQAFYFLQPLFADAVLASDAPASHRRYTWGAAQLIVSRSWVLRAGSKRRDASDHVGGLLRRVREREGAARRETWLVSAGWAPLATRGLTERGLAEVAFARPYGAVVRIGRTRVR